MATIKPFRCIRPAIEVAADVAALPYDVYNRSEACDEVKDKPLSFLRIDRAETQFDDSVDTYDERVYKKAKELLDGMISDGTFVCDNEEAYFIYELIMDGRSQTGIVACASIDDYQNNVIKKHENTRADKEADRIKHVDTCNAQTGPIFLAYRSQEAINEVVNRTKSGAALYDFVANDGIAHRVWKIDSAADIKTIRESFEKLDSIYIADGHHRAASAVRVGVMRREANPGYKGDEEFNFFLSVLFPDDQLMIMDYNRVVKDLNGYTKEEFLDKISENFEVELVGKEPYKPQRMREMGMFLDGDWYRIMIKAVYLNEHPVDSLDVSMLQKYLLTPVLGIGDPKTDKRIDFVGGIRGLKELERRCNTDMKIAFSMYPTSINQLFDVSDAGLLMPPKSTWFEPKLRSGLFIHRL
ncbi:MAG: DUF1015 domain-containing protein [Lachnospiraceae bacterium]|nr:DUF1015 domain-containing protein [Lachnospiraceae bacterium]